MEIKIILSNLLLLSIESSYPLMNLPMEQFQRSPIKGTQEEMGSPSNCLNGLALVRPLSDFGNVSFQREIWKQSVWVNRRITIYIYRLSVRHCRCGPHVDICCYHLTVIFVLFYIVSSLYYADFLGGVCERKRRGKKFKGFLGFFQKVWISLLSPSKYCNSLLVCTWRTFPISISVHFN